MRKKFFMVFMMVAAISLVGCGEKTTTTEVCYVHHGQNKNRDDLCYGVVKKRLLY